MWLTKSSIGKKVVMSVTGLCLVFFLLFHATMNMVAVFSRAGYDQITHFLGTNALVQFMVPILALFFIFHIAYSIVLTLQNLRARGSDRYAITGKSEVTWASKNMFVLGVIVLLMIGLHLSHFWAKMQLKEWTGSPSDNGYELILLKFSDPVIVALYLVWFVAIWYHLSHGFWSAFQTLGLNNAIWFKRLKVIGIVFATIICVMFAFTTIAFYLHSIGLWDSLGQIWTLGQH
ncbi:MAG: succinate dehydrogenase cytochrome b subunit [Porphyromonas sp.]|nr:succinate dehydrogenase cytochrome b subunit [Porphyromonas sp.]